MLDLLVGILLGALIYYKIYRPTKYWAIRNVPHVSSWPLVGNIAPALFTRTKHFLEITREIYDKFPNERYVGYIQFQTPSLMIRDLDLIKQIGVKEFDTFHDHVGLVNPDSDPLLTKSLINLVGDKWKQMRATLSPAFTSSKMRNMYHLMAECSENFTKNFQGKGKVSVEMKDLLTRFANDVIATTAFGIQVDSIKEPNNEFYSMGKSLTEFSVIQFIKILIFQFKKLAKLFNFRVLRQDVADFFQRIILNNIERRVNEGIVRPDLIHLMLEARKGKLKHDTHDEKHEGFATVEESHIGKNTEQIELTDEHIVAQALLFFFAGFETVSSAGSLIAYELAVNPDVQAKLQKEIDAANREHGGKVPYEALLSLKYLDAVICETLRMWPTGFQTDRLCNKNFEIKAKSAHEKDVVLERGVTIIIPIMAIHRDAKYFPDPDRFDPERFSDENKGNIVPGSYMPFGVGPRNCIGSRFALLELKTLFFHLLSKFEIVPTEITVIPMKVSPKKVNISPENGFPLALKPRQLD